jgi:H+/Cl- antiporter ClcA
MNTALSADRASTNPTTSAWPLLALVTVMTGVSAGIGGMLLALMLHAAQHIAYGYGGHGDESFLQGVIASPPLRRVVVLSVCGLVAGIGWWVVRKFGHPLVSIRTAVNQAKRMPPLTTVTHDLLQIITVALGSPLGREVAPREFGSLLAYFISLRARITPEESRIMVACGAGAGLAAVYNVPLGGALFTLEVLLESFSLSSVIPAVATSAIASYIAWIGLGDDTPYLLPRLAVTGSLVV